MNGNKSYLWLTVGLSGIVLLFLLTPPLYFIQGLSNYLPLHMAIETASIVVSFLIFGVVWNSYSGDRAGNITILAIGLMAAGFVDFLHMLSYKGMPDIVTPGSIEKAINFWLVARSLTALVFVVAAIRPWQPFTHPYTRHLMLAFTLAIICVIYWAGLWHEEAWPPTFIEGEGLTSFKVTVEYLLVILFALAALGFYRSARLNLYSGTGQLAAAAAISALSELCFTFYSDVTDTFNLLGHLYKVIAFTLVYGAVFVFSVQEPFERLRRQRIALAESDERFRQLADNIDDVFWLIDWPDNRVVYVNPAFQSVWGISIEALQQNPMLWHEQVVEEYRLHINQAIEKAVGGGKYDVVYRIRHADGQERWIHDRASVVFNDAGQPVRIAGIASDITETRRLQQAIEDSEHRLKAIFSAAQDGIVVADLQQQCFIMANDAFCKMLGVNPGDINSLGVKDIHPADQLDYVTRQFERQAAGEIKVAPDIPVLRRNGTVFYADFNSTPVDIDGRQSLLGIVHDVTERRRMEQEIAISHERMKLALSGAHDGLWDWDIEKHKVHYAARWKSMIGYQDDEIGCELEEWKSRLHPDDAKTTLEAVQAIIEGAQEELYCEYRMQHKEGHWVWILARGRVVRDRGGKAIRMVGTHVDISEIKRAQLREEEALLNLSERLKEMACLYHITALEGDLEQSIDDLLQLAVNYLPAAWQYPDDACASICFDEGVYNSPEFELTEMKQQATIRVKGIERGEVVVCYRSLHQPGDLGAFLNEEQQLIDAVAIQLAGMIELREGQSTLNRVNRILTTLSASNRSMVRSRNEHELVQSLCDILVKKGDYTRAWIGYLDETEHQIMQQAVSVGQDMTCPQRVDVGLEDKENIAVKALHDNKLQIINEKHLSKCVLGSGVCNSTVVMPFKSNQELAGVLIICSHHYIDAKSSEVDLFHELVGDLAYAINTLRGRGKLDQALSDLDSMLFQTIEAIARTVEKRDPYTAGHQQRVADLAEAIGREMHLDDHQITGIRLGSTIHDIGKIYVPAELLNRPGKLSENEFGLIKSHPQVGFDIIKDINFPWPVREMILQHHERLDGKGYPQGLRGEEIILEARIIAVADVVEAITAHRPYRPALGIDKGLQVIREGRGVLFDSEVVDCCIRLFEEKAFNW